MRLLYYFLTITALFILCSGCKDSPKKSESDAKQPVTTIDSVKRKEEKLVSEIQKDTFKLTEENAIDFFFEYQQNLKTTKVKMTTKFGSFVIQLYDNVPYHKANFIYLTKKGYFDYTQFHRVVKDFIIQGGNSDDKKTAQKRRDIGRYLLPPDTRKGYRHHRGTVSMPSSEINNPHMLASPYEFFIVVTKPGSYHLDGDFTPFGKVIEGMDVVDEINSQPVGKGDWPSQNIYIQKAEVME
ncbi:peptidylprolyl isomerase [Maribacter sp. 4U21]|uniref:peptidylprolyl isomerase n=1 Tax=Maribacter sp. 4U21 TaxID=1889779 RepID=UPI000C14F06C|nr:peptidylprolyl isomerase [Maribacter sp. 4U21]PIB27157.1 peptidylprolyl isomerase [Maribacter sp. 4U21]